MGTDEKNNVPGHDPNKDKTPHEMKKEKPPMPEIKPSATENTGADKSNFIEDFKKALKTKDFSDVKKYVEPAYEASKKAAIEGFNKAQAFVKEKTPEVIAFGKETYEKAAEKTTTMIKEMKEKQAAKKDESSQTPPASPQDKSKSSSSDSNKRPPTPPTAPPS